MTALATSAGAIVRRSRTDSGPVRWLTPMTTIDMAGPAQAPAPPPDPAVPGERLTEVAGADDHDRPVVGQAELAPNLVDQVLDLVPDATGAVRAEVAEVLADLGGVDASEVGELLGRHVRRPRLGLVEE